MSERLLKVGLCLPTFEVVRRRDRELGRSAVAGTTRGGARLRLRLGHRCPDLQWPPGEGSRGVWEAWSLLGHRGVDDAGGDRAAGVVYGVPESGLAREDSGGRRRDQRRPADPRTRRRLPRTRVRRVRVRIRPPRRPVRRSAPSHRRPRAPRQPRLPRTLVRGRGMRAAPAWATSRRAADHDRSAWAADARPDRPLRRRLERRRAHARGAAAARGARCRVSGPRGAIRRRWSDGSVDGRRCRCRQRGGWIRDWRRRSSTPASSSIDDHTNLLRRFAAVGVDHVIVLLQPSTPQGFELFAGVLDRLGEPAPRSPTAARPDGRRRPRQAAARRAARGLRAPRCGQARRARGARGRPALVLVEPAAEAADGVQEALVGVECEGVLCMSSGSVGAAAPGASRKEGACRGVGRPSNSRRSGARRRGAARPRRARRTPPRAVASARGPAARSRAPRRAHARAQRRVALHLLAGSATTCSTAAATAFTRFTSTRVATPAASRQKKSIGPTSVGRSRSTTEAPPR